MEREAIRKMVENAKKIDVNMISTNDGYHNNNGDYNYYSSYYRVGENNYTVESFSSCDFINDFEVYRNLTINTIINDIVYSKQSEDGSHILELYIDDKLISI